MNSYQKIIQISNHYYNEGLERAQVHNLSGAIESLETSLRYYKENIDARNLLGLVYYETGEWVKALREWVISANLKQEDNQAKEYMNSLKPDMARNGKINQAIKKYNQSLEYARNGSDDLAVIQLKRVVANYPTFLKAHQLLALIYIHNEQYPQAKEILRKAGRIDANNTTTLRYLKEVNSKLRGEKDKKSSKKKNVSDDTVSYLSGNETIIRPAYLRDNATFSAIGNIVFGLIVGFLISFFLVVPGVKRQASSESAAKLVEANNTISTKNVTIKQYKSQIDELTVQLEVAQQENTSSQTSANFYKEFLSAYVAYNNGEYEVAGETLAKVDDTQVEEDFRTVYETMKTQINEKYLNSLYSRASSAYNQGIYEDAITLYEKIVAIDETYNEGNAIYYLAQAYRKSGDNQKASVYYQKVIDAYPDTEKAANAKRYLSNMGN